MTTDISKKTDRPEKTDIPLFSRPAFARPSDEEIVEYSGRPVPFKQMVYGVMFGE